MSVKVLPFTPPTLTPVHPAVSEIANHAALALREAKHYRAAIAETRRAIHVSPTSRELWVNLASFHLDLHEFDEAIASVQRAISIDPTFDIPHGILALIYKALGYADLAEASFAQALELTKKPDGYIWSRSLLRLSQFDYVRGFADYEARIRHRKRRGVPVYGTFKAPLYAGEPLEGKSVYVASEQGIGDTIVFSRFLPWLASQARKIYVCAARDVTSLLWNFRDIVEFVPEGVPIPETDYVLFMGSLPHHAGVALDTLPSDSGRILQRVIQQDGMNRIDVPEPNGPNPLKIGLCWAGNPDQDHDHLRTIPFSLMLDLLDDPHIWGYGVQVGPAQQDIYAHGAARLVRDLGPEMSAGGLAAAGTALRQLDLVVTCCTAVAHLCGALNVPCWVLLNTDPYWIWGRDKENSPWYSSLRLFRQTAPGDWAGVIKAVRVELQHVLERRQ